LLINGGYTNYGQAIGILMLDTHFPRIEGDIGNALTYSFPVKYKKVKNATTNQIVLECATGLLDRFINAAQELEKEGVNAITTSCGFLSIYQKELSTAVDVPVFTSSLIQVPMIYRMLKASQKVGIITANGKTLTEKHFNGVGWSTQEIPIAIAGMENTNEFSEIFVHGTRTVMDVENVTKEILNVGKDLIKRYPNTGAIVLECTNMSPFRQVLQKHLSIPIFDIVTLIKMVYNGVCYNPLNSKLARV